MTTADDVIAALNQRRLRKRGQQDAGELPVGWAQWFAQGQSKRRAQAARGRAEEWVGALAQRLTYTQSKALKLGIPFFHLRALARPHDPREERVLRIGVGVVDIVFHLLVTALLLWMMYLRFVALEQTPEEEGQVVQVEFIGRGNAEEGGGALANAGQAANTSTASAAPATTANVPNTEAVKSVSPPEAQTAEALPETVHVPEMASIDLSKPTPELSLPAAQPLQVTEVKEPQPESFQLPPPRELAIKTPVTTLQDAQPKQQPTQIEVLHAQPVRTLQVKTAEANLKTPVLRQQAQAIEVFVPNAATQVKTLAAPTAAAQAEAKVPQLRTAARELPLATGKDNAAGDQATAAAAGHAQTNTGQGARAAAVDGRGVTQAGTGAGPGAKPAAGGWPGQAKTDDWGASKRNVAGTGNGAGTHGNGKPGLFNDDGSARLPDQWSKNNVVDLDRSGTWLKRPGLEYKGTRFDQYWIPEGTLLQEWVRRGIKQLSIPIPGTKLKLHCVVSLLQFGGGCMPVNPDVNEQPATGRKAPDIPFKPELQEDNGSVRPPPSVDPP
ncbi:MAG: hypothetical protein KUL77_01425 [Thermomonas sp.]|uniref:hypothetical protein n=1 Tax=Thermomonas sp. TaxID=1971895 RepID=UPI001EC52198|nr:hypothetical protein [Thermomonas sp.]MBV2208211.1 hypothetical protein [Thermomonas sp.]